MFRCITYLLGIDFPDNVAPLVEYGFHVAVVSLVVLFCFINVFGYLISFYLLDSYQIKWKHYKFAGILNYFKTVSWLFLLVGGAAGVIGVIQNIKTNDSSKGGTSSSGNSKGKSGGSETKGKAVKNNGINTLIINEHF